MEKFPAMYIKDFTVACPGCGRRLDGEFLVTGLSAFQPSLDAVARDLSAASVVANYAGGVTACPDCGKALPIMATKNEGEHQHD